LHAGFKVRTGKNDLRTGIAAVSARLENGTLRVVQGASPKLVHEAELYRYGAGAGDRGGERDQPIETVGASRLLQATLAGGRGGHSAVGARGLRRAMCADMASDLL
jgi:hypothetical protein